MCSQNYLSARLAVMAICSVKRLCCGCEHNKFKVPLLVLYATSNEFVGYIAFSDFNKNGKQFPW